MSVCPVGDVEAPGWSVLEIQEFLEAANSSLVII